MQNIQKLRELARDIHTFQTERGWSDAKLCKEISQVGSSKTYKRILDAEDELDDLNIDNQLRNYEAAAEMARILAARDTAPEPEYQDFSNIKFSLGAVARALKEDSNRRFVVIEGENGTGKDAVKNSLLTRWGTITTMVEATELWKESAAVPLLDIIQSLDIRRRTDEDSGEKFRVPTYPQARLELILEELSKRKTILLINEAHHMGPRCINLIKTIINRTPTIVVFLCIPVLLNRLIKSSYEECIQLFGNRLCERVRLKNPPASEILDMLDRRGVKFADAPTANDAAKAMATSAPQFGNWSFVIRVCRELRARASGRPLALDVFTAAKTTIENRLVPSRYTKAA